MTALVKQEYESSSYSAEYKTKKIEDYKKNNSQKLLEKPWLTPSFDERTGNVFLKYRPTVDKLIEFLNNNRNMFRSKSKLKEYLDISIVKYGFFSSRKEIYTYFDIRETKKQQEERENNQELKWNPIVGSGLTAIDYVNIFHSDTTGYIPVAISEKGQWKQYHFQSPEAVVNYLKPDTDCYFSPNTVFMPDRSSENIRELTSFWLDLDIYKISLSKEQAVIIIKKAVKKGILPLPTLIVTSGNGLYVFWKLRKHAPGKIKKIIKLWNNVLQALFNVAQELGLNPDPATSDPTRVLRAMGTTNTKSGLVSEVLEYNPNSLYSMSELGVKWYPLEKKKKTSSKSSKSKGKKVAHLFNSHSLYIGRISDIETICKYRGQNKIEHENREMTLFIYRYYWTLVHGHEKALEKTLELNSKLFNPLDEKEVRNYTKTTKKMWSKIENQEKQVWQGKEKDAGYHYTNKKLIEILKLKQEEMKKLKLKAIISLREKYDRNNEKRREAYRDEDGLTNRQRQAESVFNQVSQLIEQGMKQTDIAVKLGISKGRVSQLAKEIKKFNETASYINCVSQDTEGDEKEAVLERQVLGTLDPVPLERADVLVEDSG